MGIALQLRACGAAAKFRWVVSFGLRFVDVQHRLGDASPTKHNARLH